MRSHRKISNPEKPGSFRSSKSRSGSFDCYVIAVSDAERPRWFDDVEWWDLTVVESDPWPDALEAAGFTLQDIANANATLLILALRSF